MDRLALALVSLVAALALWAHASQAAVSFEVEFDAVPWPPGAVLYQGAQFEVRPPEYGWFVNRSSVACSRARGGQLELCSVDIPESWGCAEFKVATFALEEQPGPGAKVVAKILSAWSSPVRAGTCVVPVPDRITVPEPSIVWGLWAGVALLHMLHMKR